MTPLRVDLSSVTVTFGRRRALENINLDVSAGEFVAVVGPNGSGKSTLLRTIAGEVAPTRGTATVAGVPIADVGPQSAARLRSYLPQTHSGDIGFDVATVVGFGTFIASTLEEPDARVRSAMARVGVTELADRPFRELSGGEQRRVAVARVLCQGAPVMLLDEPTDSLDLGHADLVMSAAEAEAAGTRIVVSTSHDLNAAGRHASRMVLLNHGRIVRDGTPAEVLDATLLSAVYETPVLVVPHPDTGVPIVIPA
ncbi:MAG: ATP-binding cassette domain-containing protein [Acidimicrobiia bacterium]